MSSAIGWSDETHKTPGADLCFSLDQNQQWLDEFNMLTSSYKQNQYELALKSADKLNAICNRSPTLNFSIAKIYRAMGDDVKGLYYMQRATNATEEFGVKGELLERMWYERYELEHPEARPERLAQRTKEIEKRDQEIAHLNERIDQSHDANMQNQAAEQIRLMEEKSHYAAGMWVGIAGAAAGLVLTGVGAGLYAYFKDDAVHVDSDKGELTVNKMNDASVAMMGAGIGLAIIGGTIAGIMGYRYISIEDENALSFSLSPMGMNVSLTF